MNIAGCGGHVETEPEKYGLTEAATVWMQLCGKPLKVWNLTAPRSLRPADREGWQTPLGKTVRSQE